MLEVANSLNGMSADRGGLDHDAGGAPEGIGDRQPPRRMAETRILLINATGAPEGKLGDQLAGLGYYPIYLRCGREALGDISKAACSAILLDWRQEGPKDASVAEALARHALPVLTLVAAERAGDGRLAAEAGLGTVLSTPCRLADLKDALDRMLRRVEPVGRAADFGLVGATALLESCKFRFRTPEDIERLVPMIAALFPDPQRAAAGLAELMMNAIEHGNLEIGQERKADWLARGVYQAELTKRLETQPFSTRRAELIVNRREDGLMLVVMDEGCGFCWQNLISHEAPGLCELAEPCGNGIAKAQRDSFDDLRFNHIGNQVTAFVAAPTQGG